jgi:hypothetical protein
MAQKKVVHFLNNFAILLLSFVNKYVIIMNRQAVSLGKRKFGKPVTAAAGLFIMEGFDYSRC